jgi:hypothetical protein
MNAFTAYRERGWSAFPLQHRSKKPNCQWGEYQKRLPTDDEIQSWREQLTEPNYGLACGEVSGIVVVDVDGPAGIKALEKHGRLPETCCVETAKGAHYYLKHPGFRIGNKARFVEDVDLRADGGYVVAPPSVHESGHVYEWMIHPDDVPPAPIPEWLMLLINPPKQDRIGPDGDHYSSADGGEYWLIRAVDVTTGGNRDETAFWLACQLRDDGKGLAEVECVLTNYARQVTSLHDHPYTEREALATARSAFRQGAREPARHEQPPPTRAETGLYAEDGWAEEDQPKPKAKRRMFVTTDEVYGQLVSELLREPDSAPAYPPWDFPCRALHSLGGFARWAWPGKMVYILGGAGFLKTTFAEFLQDNILRDGADFAHFGPEWAPDEMGIRGMQRYGGATMDDMAEQRAFTYDELHDNHPPRGAKLNPARVTRSLEILQSRQAWPGRGYYIPAASITLKGLVDATVAAVEDSRQNGRRFVAVFWDYLEVMRRFASSQDAFWGERLATVFKNLSIDYGFTAFFLLQAKKAAATAVREAAVNAEDVRDVALGASDAQGMTDQQCNLFLTLNPVFDYQQRLTEYLYVRAVKNSGGQPGAVNLGVNPKLLQIQDTQQP